MTDVPFVMLLMAAYLAFAGAREGMTISRLWICAGVLVIAFLVRPFALASLVGCAAATLMLRRAGTDLGMRGRLLLPFIAAGVVSGLIWLWLTAIMPVPWMLALREHRLDYLYLVPVRVYFTDALIAPALYLGLVLSPLGLAHLCSARWRRGLVIAALLAIVIIPLLLTDPGAKSIPELSCCGGWDNVLVLRGPLRFVWTNTPVRLAVLAVSILGVAGLVLAAGEMKTVTPVFVAVMIGVAIYWAGSVPLWLYNDRYYLVMVPAGCLLLAMAPFPRGATSIAATVATLAVMAWFTAAGVYDQQRGIDAVMAMRNSLIQEGVARNQIDAGYPFNGNDLYQDPEPGQVETFATEAGIPLITSMTVKPFTIASAPMPDAEIVQRSSWPGVWGIGRRTLYLLKNAPQPSLVSADALPLKRNIPRRTDLSVRPGLSIAIIRLAAMALIMAAPLLAVLGMLLRANTFTQRAGIIRRGL
jgi:hypothetical protein